MVAIPKVFVVLGPLALRSADVERPLVVAEPVNRRLRCSMVRELSLRQAPPAADSVPSA
jgi:hypothetical protein